MTMLNTVVKFGPWAISRNEHNEPCLMKNGYCIFKGDSIFHAIKAIPDASARFEMFKLWEEQRNV